MKKSFVSRIGQVVLAIAFLFSLLGVNTTHAFALLLGSGIYDDTNSNWVYTGAWTASTPGPAYNSTLDYSMTPGDSASFTFSGTSFIFYYTQYTNRGNIQVFMDGSLTPLVTINASGALVWQKTYTSPTFAPGTHTVVFKHGGPSGTTIDIDAIQIFAKYDDAATEWTYTGTWTASTPGPAYNSTLHYSMTPGDTASLAFTGTSFTFYYTQYSNRGNIQVFMDGSLTPLTTINANGALFWQKGYASPTFALGPHTVVFKHGGPSGTTIDVDAITITGGSAGGTPDTLPPGAVTSLSALTSSTANDSVDLSWVAPPNDAGNNSSGPVASYLVCYSKSPLTDCSTGIAVTTGLPTPVAPGGTQNMTVPGLQHGTTYYFAVAGQDAGSNIGPYATTSAVASTIAPANDLPTSPTNITTVSFTDNIADVSTGNPTTTVGGATPDNPAIPNCRSTSGTTLALYTVWYTYTPSSSGNLNADTTGSNYDTVLAVWSGTPGSLVAVACNDNASVSTNQSQLSNVALTGGTQYFIEVGLFAIFPAAPMVTPLSELPYTPNTLVFNTQFISSSSSSGPGIYDDTSSNWVYTGAWTASTPGPAYGSTLHYTMTPADTASFTFSGTDFTLYYTQYTNRGYIQIFMDGSVTPLTTINANGPLVWQKTYTSPMFSPGTHTVVFKDGGPSGSTIDIDAIQIRATYDDAASAWVYTGAWTASTPGPAYGSTLHYTMTPGDTASLAFTGTNFTFYYTQYSNRGNIQVFMDGSLTPLVTINASGVLIWQKTYTSPTFAPGSHTIVFKHGGPSGTTIDIDAITIR